MAVQCALRTAAVQTHSSATTADVDGQTASRNGLPDSVAARAAAALRSLDLARGTTGAANGTGRNEHHMKKRLTPMSAVALAVALLDRTAASVKVAERRAGSIRLEAGPHAVQALCT